MQIVVKVLNNDNANVNSYYILSNLVSLSFNQFWSSILPVVK